MNAPSAVRPCPRCGALNGGTFTECIRCARPLPAPLQHSLGGLDGRSLLGAKLLGGLTLLVFAGQMASLLSKGQVHLILMQGGDLVDLLRFGAIPGPGRLPGVLEEEPWRLLSGVFVHFGILHVVLNMLALGDLARQVEPLVGTSRFTISYVITGICSFLTSWGWSVLMGSPFGLTAGASGAIFGVLGLLLGWFLRRRDPRWKPFFVRAVLYSLLFGFAVNASGLASINNTAHVGGLVSGVALGALFAGERSPLRYRNLVNAAAGVAFLACVASLVLAQASPLWRTLRDLMAS